MFRIFQICGCGTKGQGVILEKGNAPITHWAESAPNPPSRVIVVQMDFPTVIKFPSADCTLSGLFSYELVFSGFPPHIILVGRAFLSNAVFSLLRMSSDACIALMPNLGEIFLRLRGLAHGAYSLIRGCVRSVWATVKMALEKNLAEFCPTERTYRSTIKWDFCSSHPMAAVGTIISHLGTVSQLVDWEGRYYVAV